MKVDNIDDKIIIYLRDMYSDDLEDLCQNIIEKLKKYYNIQLKGFYEVNMYVDKTYGTVLEFNLEELDLYYDYNDIDLHIIKKDGTFLYQVDDIFDINIDYFYLYNNNFYIPVLGQNNIDCEFGKLIYHHTKEIIDKGIKCKVP